MDRVMNVGACYICSKLVDGREPYFTLVENVEQFESEEEVTVIASNSVGVAHLECKGISVVKERKI